MILSGTSGNDTIVFQQTDATHDTFTLNGISTTFSTVGVTSITINSLSGTDSISILSDNLGIPLTITGSGADTVRVGNAGNAQGILGTLILQGAAGQMSLIVDDSADSTVVTTTTISSTEVDGLTPAAIRYTSGQLASITLRSGTQNDTVHVTSTAPSTGVTVIGQGSHTTFIGPDLNEMWTMNGQHSGAVSNIRFAVMDHIIGGSGDDTFVVGTSGVFGNIDGGGGNNTLIGANIGNDWNVTGGNSGTLAGRFNLPIPFSRIENLTGGTGNDLFSFQPTGFVSGTVNGGGGVQNVLDYGNRTVGIAVNLQTNSATAIGGGFSGINTLFGDDASNNGDILVGANTANLWSLTGTNAGTVNGTFSFSHVQNLTGGTANDTFAFQTYGSFTGMISGGGGTNTLDYSALSTTVVVDLGHGVATSTGGVAAIQNVIGSSGDDTITAAADGSVITATGSGKNTLIGGAGNDTFIISANQGIGTIIDGRGGNNILVGPNVANIWNITDVNAGTLNGIAFRSIQNLMGGTANDMFSFYSAGFVSGAINGGGGGGTDTLDYSRRSVGVAVNLQLNSATAIGGGFSNILNLVGSSALDTLVGPNVGNAWTITSGNTGTLLSQFRSPFNFSGIENLTGGTANDVFSFQPTGFIAGAVNGGGGTQNVLDYGGRTAGIVVNLQTNSATAIGGGFSGINTLFGDDASNNDDTLIGANTANAWTITGTNGGTVNGAFSFSHVQNLTGGSGDDTLTVQTYGSMTGLIQGAGGTNTLIGSNSANTWNITAANSGSLNGTKFANISNLTGGTGIDTFLIGNIAGITGMLNGGNPTGDWLDYSPYTSPVTVNLATGAATNIGGGVTNIQNVRGGNGGNTLVGNSVGNILVGGNGNDTLTAGNGRSILLAVGQKTNNDSLVGGTADDILIGGTTSYDIYSPANNAALAAIFAEWQSSNSYSVRIGHITGSMSGGLNGSNDLIYGTTVIDQGGSGTLTGNGGTDWFFAGVKDQITDLQPGERVN